MHELSPDRATLPPIEGWPVGDSRTLLFTVTLDDAGTPKDVTNDTLRWALLDKPYADRADSVVDDSDAGVTIRRAPYTDPAQGEFEVLIEEDVVAEWGRLWQEVVVDPLDTSRQTWVGPVVLSDS